MKLERNTFIALGTFIMLTVIYGATHQSNVRVGLRELSLPTLSADLIERIEVGGAKTALLTRESDKWFVASPEKPDTKYPADEAAVKRALDALAEAKPGAFVTAKSDKYEELEISDDKALKVKVKAGTTNLEIWLGRFAKGGGNYVRRAGDDEVFVLSGSVAVNLKKDVNAWRRRKLFDIKADALSSVEIALRDGPALKLVHDKTHDEEGKVTANVWKLDNSVTVPAGFRVDSDALSRVARSFANLRAADFVDDDDAIKSAGLDTPAAKITGKLEDGTSTSVTFGASNDKKQLFTKVEGDAQIYLVADYTARQLMKSLDDLRSLALFDGIDADTVSKIVFTSSSGTVTVEKTDDAWTSTPALEGFDPTVVSGKLRGLLRLKGARFLGSADQVRASYRTPVSIAITHKDGAVRTATFGDAVPEKEGDPKNQVFAKNGDGFVYAIAQFQKARYEKPAELFKAVKPPPGAGGGLPGNIPGLENLPPELRKQLEQQLKQGAMGGGH